MLTVVFGLRRVGEEQHRQAVGEAVFGDALDGGALGDAGRQRRADAGGDQQRERGMSETARRGAGIMEL